MYIYIYIEIERERDEKRRRTTHETHKGKTVNFESFISVNAHFSNVNFNLHAIHYFQK